jgi:allantoin racemase
MKIIVVNVNTSESMTGVIAAGARRYASAGTQTVVLRPYFGPGPAIRSGRTS